MTSTFSDGHTVDVTPQPAAGHPGWNFWAIETETMHESYDPWSDIVLVSVTAHNAAGDVLSAIRAAYDVELTAARRQTPCVRSTNLDPIRSRYSIAGWADPLADATVSTSSALAQYR